MEYTGELRQVPIHSSVSCSPVLGHALTVTLSPTASPVTQRCTSHHTQGHHPQYTCHSVNHNVIQPSQSVKNCVNLSLNHTQQCHLSFIHDIQMSHVLCQCVMHQCHTMVSPCHSMYHHVTLQEVPSLLQPPRALFPTRQSQSSSENHIFSTSDVQFLYSF